MNFSTRAHDSQRDMNCQYCQRQRSDIKVSGSSRGVPSETLDSCAIHLPHLYHPTPSLYSQSKVP